MTMKELMSKTPKQLEELHAAMFYRQNPVALAGIEYVQKYAHKRVRVVKGRKVPKGTEGECFWLGSYCNSPYGDPWGIYTTFRCGIRDDTGTVHWTAIDNIELAEAAT